jgi:hypothetical protein
VTIKIFDNPFTHPRDVVLFILVTLITLLRITVTLITLPRIGRGRGRRGRGRERRGCGRGRRGRDRRRGRCGRGTPSSTTCCVVGVRVRVTLTFTLNPNPNLTRGCRYLTVVFLCLLLSTKIRFYPPVGPAIPTSKSCCHGRSPIRIVRV